MPPWRVDGLESEFSRFLRRTIFCLRQLQPNMQAKRPQWLTRAVLVKLAQMQPSLQNSFRQEGFGLCGSWIGAVGFSLTKP